MTKQRLAQRFFFLILFAMAVPAATAHADSLGTVADDSCIVYTTVTGVNVFFCDADIRPTGTGVFDPFLRVGRDGTGGNPDDDTKSTYSSGWNTDATHQDGVDGFNDFDASWSSALPVGDINLTATPPSGAWGAPAAGSSYALFTVDINQVASSTGSILSLNQMLLYNCDDPDPIDLSECTNFFNLFGDKPGDDLHEDFVNFNYRLHTGSGSGDIDVFIENNGAVDWFDGPFITLLDGWGCGSGASIDPAYPCSTADIHYDNDGFQEWATTVGPPGGTIPEPASLLLLGSGLSAIGVAARRRRNQKKS